MLLINGKEIPEPPYHEGTTLELGDGRLIHVWNPDEARELSAAAAFVADNWEN